MSNTAAVIETNSPGLIFGGPYSNLQATRAMLAEARRLGIPSSRILCTGDLAAYCGDPAATIALIRENDIAVVRGNCDEQLGADADSCGCGFPEGSACERLSDAWYAIASSQIGANDRDWLRDLPYRIDLKIGGRRFAVIHGSVSAINHFVFATTPTEVKRRELDLAGCDGVIGGHCGLPFTEVIDGRLWHNPGVIGMPANDGTARVWFSLLSPDAAGLRIEHCALDYDHHGAARAMEGKSLPQEYARALHSGLWANCDVLPAREKLAQGIALEPASFVWPNAEISAVMPSPLKSALLWPKAHADQFGAVSAD